MRVMQMMAYLIDQPWVALFPFLLLLGLYKVAHRRSVLGVALVWVCYIPYEYGMKFRILCSGECNIRIDLLLIYPALLILSLIAVALGIQRFLGNRAL